MGTNGGNGGGRRRRVGGDDGGYRPSVLCCLLGVTVLLVLASSNSSRSRIGVDGFSLSTTVTSTITSPQQMQPQMQLQPQRQLQTRCCSEGWHRSRQRLFMAEGENNNDEEDEEDSSSGLGAGSVSAKELAKMLAARKKSQKKAVAKNRNAEKQNDDNNDTATTTANNETTASNDNDNGSANTDETDTASPEETSEESVRRSMLDPQLQTKKTWLNYLENAEDESGEEIALAPAPAPAPAPADDEATTVKQDSDSAAPSKKKEETTPVFYANRVDDNNNDNDNRPPVAEGLDLKTVASVAGDIAKEAGTVAKDVLSVLRFGAANLLTASLPEDQRQDLLERMGASSAPLLLNADQQTMAKAAAEMVQEKVKEERGSIQEEIALARAEEAQKSETKWKRQKEEILEDMEKAANARVENELKIQKQKLEEETSKALRETERSVAADIERLEEAVRAEQERAEALLLVANTESGNDDDDDDDNDNDNDEADITVGDLFAFETDEEVVKKQELEALIEEKKKQQVELESIEDELRNLVESEKEERERLQAMLEKRKAQQDDLNTLEAGLKKQVREIEAEKISYQQMVADLESLKEKQQLLQQEASERETTPKTQATEDAEAAAAAAAATSEEAIDGDAKSEEDEVHPVLGPVIADLGYKRIHFVSAGRLGTIPVWRRNRTYRNNRAKSMASDKMKTLSLGFPGAICLHEASSGKLSIVDGQHRVGMMTALKENINKKNDGALSKDTEAVFENVLVEVYPEPASKRKGNFAEQVFLEINKAEPVKLIDMPGVASANDRQIITEAVETLNEQFEEMFSPSQRCRVPNVNTDNLRSIIFGANILKRHKLTTGKKLADWLLEQNAALGDEYETDKLKQKLVSKKQWKKASDNKFYLGLESSWLYK